MKKITQIWTWENGQLELKFKKFSRYKNTLKISLKKHKFRIKILQYKVISIKNGHASVYKKSLDILEYIKNYASALNFKEKNK